MMEKGVRCFLILSLISIFLNCIVISCSIVTTAPSEQSAPVQTQPDTKQTVLPEQSSPESSLSSQPPHDSTPVTSIEKIRIEEKDASFKYSIGWLFIDYPTEGRSVCQTSFGQFGYTKQKLDIQFTGTGVYLVHLIGPKCGVINIKIDGIDYASIDTYAPEMKKEQITCIATDLSNDIHVLTITPSDVNNPEARPAPNMTSPNPVIAIDAIEVIVPCEY